jgi:hypothetical protein
MNKEISSLVIAVSDTSTVQLFVEQLTVYSRSTFDTAICI